VNGDGSTGTATRIAMNDVTTGDGMAIDYLGNLYVASNSLIIVNPAGSGTKIGAVTVSGVQQVSDAAFGGADTRPCTSPASATAWAAPPWVSTAPTCRYQECRSRIRDQRATQSEARR
jgi:hypothetical protein